jgi:hypothetical protein
VHACVDRRLRCTCPFGRSACAETACDWATSLSRSCGDGTHGLSRGWAATLCYASSGQAQHACARPTRLGRGSRRRTMTCGVMELRIDCPLRSPRRRRCVCQHAGEHGERPVSPHNRNNTDSGCQDHELFHAPYPFCPSFLPYLAFLHSFAVRPPGVGRAAPGPRARQPSLNHELNLNLNHGELKFKIGLGLFWRLIPKLLPRKKKKPFRGCCSRWSRWGCWHRQDG